MPDRDIKHRIAEAIWRSTAAYISPSYTWDDLTADEQRRFLAAAAEVVKALGLS